MDAQLLEEMRRLAELGLIANGGEAGLYGSNEAYRQVWARDSMICGLGLLLCRTADGATIHRQSLETLRNYQSPLGKIPHNVGFPNVFDPALIAHGGLIEAEGSLDLAIEDTAHAGCIDGNLWYILGHYFNFMARHDRDFLHAAWNSLQQSLLWLRYQDVDECGLLEVHEAMDWADLFANRGNVLFDNVLYFAAWKCMGYLARALDEPDAFYFEAAARVRRRLNALFWVGPESAANWTAMAAEQKKWLDLRAQIETALVERSFYLPYVTYCDYADRFDTFGNLLAILFGVANARQANKILDYVGGCGLAEPFPVQAVYPVIRPDEPDWREYYRVRNLNQPHHYHNGGAWPFLGGFYVAALVQAGRLAEARQHLAKLAQMNHRGRRRPDEFNEWFHGLSGQPMGFAGQSWSLALYIFAYEAVQEQQVPVLHAGNGWRVDDGE